MLLISLETFPLRPIPVSASQRTLTSPSIEVQAVGNVEPMKCHVVSQDLAARV